MAKQQTVTNKCSVTFVDVTPAQFAAITALLANGGRGPKDTVSPDESVDFGKKALTEEDLNTIEEKEPTVTRKQLQQTIDKLSELAPKQTVTILKRNGLKTVKDLFSAPNKWDTVFAATMSAIKEIKRAEKLSAQETSDDGEDEG